MRDLFVIIILHLCLLGFAGKAPKQTPKKFAYAKEQLKEGNYLEAMLQFKLVVDADDNEGLKESAMYLYAQAAFKVQKFDEANFMLFKLINQGSNWEGRDEAIYLYLNVALEAKQTFKIYKFIHIIKDTVIAQRATEMKYHYFEKKYTIDELWSVLGRYPDDLILAKIISSKIQELPRITTQQEEILSYIKQDYLSGDRNKSTRVSERKDTYRIAVLLPFMLKNYAGEYVDNSITRKLAYYDFYKGMELALDEINKGNEKPKYELYAYDTESDASKVKEILEKEELSSMDLVIGYTKKHGKYYKDFSNKNLIYVLDPYTRTDSLKPGYENVYYNQSSYLAEGASISEFISSFKEEGKLFIYYDKSDSRNNRVAQKCMAELKKLEVADSLVVFKPVNNKTATTMKMNILIEGEKENIGAIVLLTDNNLVKSNLISALENGEIEAPVIVDKKWLDYQGIEIEQYNRRNFHFVYAGFNFENAQFTSSFRTVYKDQMAVNPLKKYPFWGYDFMIYWSKVLKDYGNFFGASLVNEPVFEGKLTPGYYYKNQNDNQIVPIVRLNDEYQFEYVNKPN